MKIQPWETFKNAKESKKFKENYLPLRPAKKKDLSRTFSCQSTIMITNCLQLPTCNRWNRAYLIQLIITFSSPGRNTLSPLLINCLKETRLCSLRENQECKVAILSLKQKNLRFRSTNNIWRKIQGQVLKCCLSSSKRKLLSVLLWI